MSRCEYVGLVGENLDPEPPLELGGLRVRTPTRCRSDATRQVDARALGAPDDALDVCEEHFPIIRAWWERQAAEAP